MARYYVNKKAQTTGDHEVHKTGCHWMPKVENRQYLGEYSSCEPAVAKARITFPTADGCYYCSNECNSG